MTSDSSGGNRVRDARMAAGLTQAELAALAGVARTSVTAIEGNRLVPSVRVALGIARALQQDVGALFGDAPDVVAADWAWAPPTTPWRFHLAEIRGRVVRIPVEATDLQLWPHDPGGHDTEPTPRHNDLARRTLVMATCDPAAALLAALCREQQGIRVLTIVRSSRAALDLLAAGMVHVAGVHVGHGSEGTGNSALAAERLHGKFLLMRAAEWTEGIAVGARTANASVSRLKDRKVRWAGREPGSGARQCLDELLGPRRRYAVMTKDHRGVVEMVASGVADAGVCVQLAGQERGLRFIPLQQEHYDLCVPADLEEDVRVRALRNVLRSREYRRLFGDLPGYATHQAGDCDGVR